MNYEKLREAVVSSMNKENPEGFYTTREIQEMTGMGKDWVLGAIRSLNKIGKVEIRTINKEDLSGRIQKVPGYRLLL